MTWVVASDHMLGILPRTLYVEATNKRNGKLQETGGRKAKGATAGKPRYASQLSRGGHGMKKETVVTVGVLAAMVLATIVQQPWFV